MSTIGRGATSYDAPFQAQEEPVETVQYFSALPQPLLELILIPGTSTKDKKALRQTCKSFLQVLDYSVTCLRLHACARRNHKYLKKLMMRLQHAYGLSAIKYTGHVGLLPQLLPKQVTSFEARDCSYGIEELRRLPCLTSLRLLSSRRWFISGIQHIHGLTRLHTDCSIGSVGHLAPTLKHLSINSFNNVQSMEQLTNLEVLEVRGCMPLDFFDKHIKLPLQHIRVDLHGYLGFYATPWESAPTTLTSLSLLGDFSPESYAFLGVLPSSITHLQLGSIYNFSEQSVFLQERRVEVVATDMPGLKEP